MSSHLFVPVLFAIAWLALAAPAEAEQIINESDFGDFSDGPGTATDIPVSSTETTIINGGEEDGADFFDFTLTEDASPVTIELFGQILGGATVLISSGLNANSEDIASLFDSVPLGLTVLPDLPAGSYTFGVGDGGDFTYQVTINPVPEPSSFLLAALSLLSLGFFGFAYRLPWLRRLPQPLQPRSR